MGKCDVKQYTLSSCFDWVYELCACETSLESGSIRVHLFGKNPNPDSESKNGFFVSLVKSKKGL